MDSIVGYLHVTQGAAYLIAIALLFVFVALWVVMNPASKGGLAKKAVPLLVLAVGVGALAFVWLDSHEQSEGAPVGSQDQLMNKSELVEMYGPASFDHALHQNTTSDCTVCHHKGGGTSTLCEECHGTVFDPADLSKPGLSRVFHLLCISCHKENQVGPTECTGCHTQAAIPPLSIAHPLTGVDNCLLCHHTQIPGVPQTPSDHTGVTNGECQLCHKPLLEPTALAKYPLPHPVVEHEDCLLCHGEGIGGARMVPSDHTGRTDETCLICHGTSSDPATPVVPTAMTHGLLGRDDCLLCHGIDTSQASVVPADHAGRTDDTCLYCHGIPHEANEGSDCLLCHGRTLDCIGSDPIPGDHAGYGNDSCLDCHGVPHGLEGRHDCLLCHGAATTESTLVPEDHAGRTNNSCLFCHTPA